LNGLQQLDGYVHRVIDAKYGATKRGRMKGAQQETFDAIDALKPYKGANDLLGSLYRPNNIESTAC
jgi:hypothetical protein